MPCDLQTLFGPLAAQLPTGERDPFPLDETNLPIPPAELSSDRLWIRGSRIQYMPGCRGDYVDVVAEPSLFRQLGLLILAVMFHESGDRATIHVTNPDSAVKHVVVQYLHWDKLKVSGFRVRPAVLGYVVDKEAKVLQPRDTKFGAPILRLSNLTDCQRNESDWMNRDALWVGSGLAMGELAEFLLNAGQEPTSRGLFVISANRDFFTAEVSLWTPETWQRVQQRLRDNAKNIAGNQA